MLIKKEHKPLKGHVKAIPGELQHALLVADVDKKKIRKVERKTGTEREKISLLKDAMIRKRI